MKYRELHTKDYPALKQMLTKLQDFFLSINDEYRKFSDATAEEYLDKIVDDTKKMNGRIILALKNERAIGFTQGVIIEKNDLQYHPCREGWVGLLYVEDEFRNQDVGRTLMDKMRDYFSANKCDSIKLFCYNQNTTAIDFYQKYGFTVSSLELKLQLAGTETCNQ